MPPCPAPQPPGSILRWALFLLWLCVGTWANAAPAPAVLVLREAAATVQAWPAVTVLADATRQHTLADMQAQVSRFEAPAGAGGTLGVRPEAMWLRMELMAEHLSDGRWALDIDYPPLNRIDMFLTLGGQVVQHATLGNLQPYSQRPLRTRSHTVAMNLVPGQPYELWLRVETTGAMVLPITLNKPAAQLSRAVHEQMLQGVLTGLALCLLVYSLAQWASLRDPLFVQYALLLTGSLLFSLHFFGVGQQYLWTDNPWFEVHGASLAALMATCGSFLFISQSLVGHLPRSRLLWAMRSGAVLCVVLALVYALDGVSTHTIARIVSILGLVPALMGIPGAVQRARSGDSIGTTFLLAWLVYFGSTAVVVGVIRGWLPVNFWTLHSFQFGATIDMLLFMRVLGEQARRLRKAAQVASQERDAMRSLAHTDPLTGLVNRRGLHAALSSALARCDPQSLLAVYVMDLDGFKPVNDQHGHDVGDALLVAATRRLLAQVRHNDVVARVGGDEFVVMTSGLATPGQAQDLGLELLKAFRTPFALDDLQLSVGLTIGYAIAPLDAQDASTLLKRADAAMYSGKQAGKFCLRRNRDDLAPASA
ncbi:diguanylate cyclase [Acidovorax soli]|uniref:Diguanylate cyclase (GGDEF) domain-containing protein n=1 Tax=Acidovorax soli TaxID=592050 RepID=A0A1H4B6T9_9BURK|nr:diguanylate cyclase [Acidovorax soli]SEA43859.1 diguanylate cyclase (GGDEF) domain-containing protein [Acidovorax soli]